MHDRQGLRAGLRRLPLRLASASGRPARHDRHPGSGQRRRPVPDHRQQRGDRLAAVEGDQVGGCGGVDERGDLGQVGEGEVAWQVHASRVTAPPRRPCGGYRGGNALTETSSTGHASSREPPAAEKAASRPGAKTLPSAGRNGGRTPAARPMPRRLAPVTGPERGRPGPPGGGESAVAPRVPFSPALPRGRQQSREECDDLSSSGRRPARGTSASSVRIAGWLHRRRELKSVTFLIVRDRSGLAQVVLPGPATRRRTGRPRQRPACRRRPSSRSPATVVASAEAPGGAELHRAGGHRAVRPGRAAAVRPVPARR